jgi:hypothetical protein
LIFETVIPAGCKVLIEVGRKPAGTFPYVESFEHFHVLLLIVDLVPITW